MDRQAWMRMGLGTVAIFIALAVWITLSVDDRSCEQLLRDGIGQAQLPDRCWR